ncbi:HAD family hydrolase [Kribbella antibiotica]|uniref:HAD family hydrolase n=1 Tax=Kribbella antibiotica TaxID=190195 RepID=A0A4R4YKH2_9ACTN|nr:HAD-IA family hydrolase [Kribbella antibiotica]TDD44539.1 HAD family hydrolase [Kribbella antibiotica]
MTSAITTVLFDADGVIQRGTQDWTARLYGMVEEGVGEEFITDLMRSERPAIAGKEDFRDAIADVLTRWNATATVSEAIEPWHWFAAEPVVVDLIQKLRRSGIQCHLATNQHAYRRDIMRDDRGYDDLFDQSFYSCDLGLAKPDPAYFRAILGATGVPASSVLFIDDIPANVEGARSIGIKAEVYDLANGTDALSELLRSYELPA